MRKNQDYLYPGAATSSEEMMRELIPQEWTPRGLIFPGDHKDQKVMHDWMPGEGSRRAGPPDSDQLDTKGPKFAWKV
jgi:hypothetical protein